MKFGQKVFLISFILIILSIYGIGYMTIKNNYISNIDKEIDRGLYEHKTVLKTVYLDVESYLEEYKKELQMAQNSMSSSYRSTINEMEQEIRKTVGTNIIMKSLEGKNFEVYKNGNLVFTNLLTKKEKTISELEASTENAKIYISEDENGKMVMLISSRTDIEGDVYDVITGVDVTEVYTVREEQIAFFIKITIMFSLGISIILYLFVYLITRRIKKLNDTVEKISNGNYNVKLTNMGKDEIGKLADGFNSMVESVNHNVKQIEQESENKQDFINNLTHEIRTPLTSIIGFSELLKKVKITDEEVTREYADRISKEGKYIKSLSDKLMDITMLGNTGLDLKEINISEVIR